MTNSMIILSESVRLMEEGKLKSSGKFVKITDADGSEKTLEMPIEIHTFNGWKERGFCVRKGEKSTIKFPIWKHIYGKENEEGKKKDHMFMKLSAFFTEEQVEPINAEAV